MLIEPRIGNARTPTFKMAKTPSKKSAKAPKKAGESKKPRKKTESYSTYIYRVLKQAPFGVLFLVARH